VVLGPKACQIVKEKFPEAEILIEPSPIRVFSDQAYVDAGFELTDNMQQCDVLLGVKEVPIEALIPNKKYFFFSHTIKKQSYNRKLLQAVLDLNIELYDHEVITNKEGQRLVAFGRYAGIVGAYNGIRTYGLKFDLFDLPKAETLSGIDGLISELQYIKLPNIKIVVSGKGRVSGGVKEILDAMGIIEVEVSDYINKSFDQSVYCQIEVLDYNKRIDGEEPSIPDFYKNPQYYQSDFMRFAQCSDMYIAGHFYGDGAPYLYTREDVKSADFNVKVVADISCDIDGPVATTIRPSTIADPIYGYDPTTARETDFKNPEAIAVMAVDNLPCEIPADASEEFGASFINHVIPALFNKDNDGVLQRAKMTSGGKLTELYNYLQDYVEEK
jgi:alanine dehydrogenase